MGGWVGGVLGQKPVCSLDSTSWGSLYPIPCEGLSMSLRLLSISSVTALPISLSLNSNTAEVVGEMAQQLGALAVLPEDPG